MTAPAADGPYGPATPRVRRFLQHVAALSSEQWDAVVRRYAEVAGTTRWVEADYHLGIAVDESARAGARDALVEPVVRLAAARGGDVDAGAEALLGAVLAVVVADRLDADLFETLYGPFEEAIPTSRLTR